MVFRTAGAIATVLINLSGQALAQYYPPPQAYPRPPVPHSVTADELPALNAPVVQGDPLPPVGVGPAYQPMPGARYQPGTGGYPADTGPLPPAGSPGYQSVQPQDYGPATANPYGLRGVIPPGPPGSAKQDAIREEAMRSRLRNSPGQIGLGPAGPPVSGPMQGGEPGEEAMRSRLRNSPGQIGLGPAGPPVSGPMQGGEPGNMAALPPEVRPETEPNKELAPRFRRTLVDYRTKEPAGTIIVDTSKTYLYLVVGDGKALRYGIGVGREGFTWSGVERVTRTLEWPDWTPPDEMIVRQPYLPRFMAGGETNPLGARALYLGNTIYRIHGTNQPSTIGTFVSSGCIRLTNEDVMDLYRRVRVGTRVVVLPGRPPTATSLAPLPAMPPGNASVQAGPPQSPASAMAR
jgi:lipoprotein-anchoring transpeptidase ErfK/SrfK